MRSALAAGVGAVLAAIIGADAQAEPVDYVGTCDAYGTGFFYIPGTENCIRISGSVRYSGIENPSRLGAGTTVTGGLEGFTFSSSNWINRYGGSVEWESGLGKDAFGTKLFHDYYGFHFGEVSFATGGQISSGTSEVGVGGVTQIGLTFGAPDTVYGAGVGTTTPGFGVAGWANMNSTWGRAMAGIGKTFLGGGEERSDRGVYISPRFGGFAEYLSYTGSGSANITFGGTPFSGFYQNYNYGSGDTWVGGVLGADLHFQFARNVEFNLGGDVLPGYHWGNAAIDMQTGVGGGNVVSENYRYDNSGFTVGVSLRAGLDVKLADNWTAGIGYQWSLLPGVTGVDKPAEPTLQPLNFTSQSVQRHEVMLRIRRSF